MYYGFSLINVKMHGVTKLLKKEGGGCSCLLLRSVLSFSTKEDKKKLLLVVIEVLVSLIISINILLLEINKNNGN